MMIIDNKFEFGQFVYLKTDPDQEKRMVTEMKLISIGKEVIIVYWLNFGSSCTLHYENEISAEKNLIEN
jgi:hypothetical protein